MPVSKHITNKRTAREWRKNRNRRKNGSANKSLPRTEIETKPIEIAGAKTQKPIEKKTVKTTKRIIIAIIVFLASVGIVWILMRIGE